ncbi:MAG: hypothetical protein P8166_16500 [Candidatus Thiodiazotropha sp.]
MTTEQNNSTSLVNCLQQTLYPGKSGDSTAEATSSGWWTFQYDPSNPTLLTMLVTLTTKPTGDDCLTYYSSQLNTDDVKSLYQWLALQLNQQKADSGKKTPPMEKSQKENSQTD